MKDYCVFTLKLANKLVDKGFKVIRTGINLDKPQFKVFYFEDTAKLRQAVAELTKA